MEDQSGYIGLSQDDKLLAVGVLKVDTVNIYEMETGDLLASIEGGRKAGFWGSLTFLPHPQNNALLEFRELDKYKKKTAESVVRLWHLGFRPEEEEDDEDGDEEETKVWERSKRGHFDYALCGPDMLIATNADCIDWMDYSTGDILRHVPVDKICSKAVMTSDLKFVAVAHLSHCSVLEVSTGEVVATVKTPDSSNDVYPLTPVQFIESDSMLVLRVNQDKSLVLSLWRLGSEASISVSRVGGTSSDDSVAISNDESLLVCWPYGELEVYDLLSLKHKLVFKFSLSLRRELVCLRGLLRSDRALCASEENAVTKLLDYPVNKHEEESKNVSYSLSTHLYLLLVVSVEGLNLLIGIHTSLENHNG